tara:strand:+ start:96 stop:506 length:411 start_codon:yes stop_codon:yes gene_type:complete
MPKIEAGTTLGAFLVDGRPYTTGDYTCVYAEGATGATTSPTNIAIIPKKYNTIIDVASDDLANWTDNNDNSFATLQDFWDYIEKFFFLVDDNTGSDVVTYTNDLNVNLSSLNTLMMEMITEQKKTNKYLRKIYNPN